MGNQQSQQPFSSPGNTLGGVPVGGVTKPTPTQAPPASKSSPLPRPTQAPSVKPSAMPGSGQQLDGGTGGSTRAPLEQRLASAGQGVDASNTAQKAREARDAAARAAEARVKSNAAQKTGTGKVKSASEAVVPERIIYE